MPGDPNRHFDGQQWLVWNGTAWVPEAPVAPPSTGGKRTLLIVVAIVVVALVAGGAFIASKVMNAEKPIVVPTSLGGLDKSTDASITSQADQLRTSLGPSIHGAKFDVGAYGGADAGAIAILVAARNGGSADEFFSGIKSSGLDVSDQTKVGDSSCVTASAEQVTICLRSSSGLDGGRRPQWDRPEQGRRDGRRGLGQAVVIADPGHPPGSARRLDDRTVHRVLVDRR